MYEFDFFFKFTFFACTASYVINLLLIVEGTPNAILKCIIIGHLI